MAVRLPFLLMIAALALSACATPPAQNALDAASDSNVRVVVAPLNLTVRAPAEIDGQGERVWHELLRYLQAQDRAVATLSPTSAERLWLEATLDLDLSDRSRALRAACARFAQAVATHRDYDLLVVPSLVLRVGHLHGHYASWDGVQRFVPNSAGLLSADLHEAMRPASNVWVSGLRGKVAAASLHVSLLLPDGTNAYEGLGGLDLIQEAHRDHPWDGKWTFAVRDEIFSEPEHLREGVARAFEHPLLATASGR